MYICEPGANKIEVTKSTAIKNDLLQVFCDSWNCRNFFLTAPQSAPTGGTYAKSSCRLAMP